MYGVCTVQSSSTSKPSCSSRVALLGLGHVEPEHRVGVAGAEGNLRRCRDRATHFALARPARARELDEELRCVGRSRARELGVDALLPARLALGAHAVALTAAQHRQRLEVRRLQQDPRRLAADLGVRAAHDAADRDRPLRIRDHEVVGVELAGRAVERLERLARLDARRTTMRPPRASHGRTRAAGCQARASRSS